MEDAHETPAKRRSPDIPNHDVDRLRAALRRLNENEALAFDHGMLDEYKFGFISTMPASLTPQGKALKKKVAAIEQSYARSSPLTQKALVRSAALVADQYENRTLDTEFGSSEIQVGKTPPRGDQACPRKPGIIEATSNTKDNRTSGPEYPSPEVLSKKTVSRDDKVYPGKPPAIQREPTNVWSMDYQDFPFLRDVCGSISK